MLRRRHVLLGLPAVFAAAACASNDTADDQLLGGPQGGRGPETASAQQGETYTEDEVVSAVEDWLGVSAETAASIVEKIFSDLGRPNAYIQGGEGAGAIGVGLRYGDGTLVTKSGQSLKVYWQGPSIGFDTGANASRCFTLVYNLPSPDAIFRRYPGVEGSAYFIGGVGVNYQRADNITLAPMRVGVGFRAGANVGYLAYSRNRNILPF
jgi:hypothetical protein